MGNSQTMPEVDFKDEKLKSALLYRKRIETRNFERAIIAKKTLSRNRKLLVGLVTLVISIYSFTIYKIKQETFLDDFEEPPRIIKEEN